MAGVIIDLTDEFLRRQRILPGDELRLKHLPGQHDQQAHDPHKGRAELVYYDPEEMQDLGNPWGVADEAGLYISSNKDVAQVAIVDGQIVGALFEAVDLNSLTYSADIVVLPEHQGRGIGSQLVDATIENFRDYQADFDLTMEIDAINPKAVEMLERRGAEVVGTTAHHVQLRLKHQAGRHDQKAHTPKKYGKGDERGYVGGRSIELSDLEAVIAGSDAMYDKYPDSRDPILQSILEQQGFDGLPEVMADDELDKYEREEIPLWRGVGDASGNGEAHNDRFRNGELWVGRGISGNGLYFATTDRAAAHYARENGAALRTTLRSDARVIKLDDIHREMIRHQEGMWDEKRAKLYDDFDADRIGADEFRSGLKSVSKQYTEHRVKYGDVVNDEGRLAAALGYDAIRASGGTYVVLNRTALRVSDKDYKFDGVRVKQIGINPDFSRFMAGVFNSDVFRVMPIDLRRKVYQDVLESNSVGDLSSDTMKWVGMVVQEIEAK